MDEVLIVGAGPAGLAAALQLRRYGLAARIFEAGQIGGLLRNANLVENYPGFPRGVSGARLAKLFERQLQQAGVQVTFEAVDGLDWDGACFQAVTAAGRYTARLAVIASGTRPCAFERLDIPAALRPRLYYEVYPLLDLRGQQVVIVGAGDAAFDYALNLSRQNQVIILNRSAQVKCLPLLWERAQACQNITYRPQTEITRLVESPAGGMTVECSSPASAVLHADYLIGALGREPQTDFLSPALGEQATELASRGILHFVGDVKNGIYRQTAIAVGDGLRAAMHIYRWLEENSK